MQPIREQQEDVLRTAIGDELFKWIGNISKNLKPKEHTMSTPYMALFSKAGPLWRWSLFSQNGTHICKSRTYSRKCAAKRGLKRFLENLGAVDRVTMPGKK